MSKNATQPGKFKIHVGKYGGVRVDPEEFFADPEVKRKIELMEKTTLVGRSLDFKKHPPGDSN